MNQQNEFYHYHPYFLCTTNYILRRCKKSLHQTFQGFLQVKYKLGEMKLIDRLLYLSNNLEEEDLIKTLTELKKSTHNATQLAKELYRLDKKIKELFNKV